MERREKRYNYFYRITNTIDGKYYYGVHSTDDLDDGYFGSGKRLKLAIKKHGAENFVKEIIKFFDSADDMYAYERSVVDMGKVRDRQCYNMAIGGEGGNRFVDYTEDEMVELRERKSKSMRGKNTWMKGTTQSKESNQKRSKTLMGHSVSEETRKKISNANKGKHHSEDARKKISESMRGKNTWMKDRPISEETRKKISEALKGKSSGPKGKHWRLDPTTNRRTYY